MENSFQSNIMYVFVGYSYVLACYCMLFVCGYSELTRTYSYVLNYTLHVCGLQSRSFRKTMLIKLSGYNSYCKAAGLARFSCLEGKLFARANSARGEITNFERMM